MRALVVNKREKSEFEEKDGAKKYLFMCNVFLVCCWYLKFLSIYL